MTSKHNYVTIANWATQVTFGGLVVRLLWKRVRSSEWTGRDGELNYTIRQGNGARFKVIRALEPSPFAILRSLALAKAMAEEDASDRRKSCAGDMPKSKSPPLQ
jgi:hypothetical protein